ncbi:MAG: L,D-transpeptidase [Chromatiales bacterium]|jgi:hypothetical protein
MTDSSQLHIEISIARQQLCLLDDEAIVQCWPVSTAANGAGQQLDSGCTPTGQMHIRLKIGAGCTVNTVFVGRRPTGETYSEQLAQQQPARDWILTRIIWLTGNESGFNRGGNVDTLRRFIYIHGTPDTEPMGVAQSHGCIRMRNQDLIQLFEQVHNGMPVNISAD